MSKRDTSGSPSQKPTTPKPAADQSVELSSSELPRSGRSGFPVEQFDAGEQIDRRTGNGRMMFKDEINRCAASGLFPDYRQPPSGSTPSRFDDGVTDGLC